MRKPIVTPLVRISFSRAGKTKIEQERCQEKEKLGAKGKEQSGRGLLLCLFFGFDCFALSA
jgi:hypothetical protein